MAIDVEKPSVDESVVRYQARTILLQLAYEVASSARLTKPEVKAKIKKAIKIRRWLKALDYKEFLTYDQRYMIVYKLIEISGVNDFPTAPVLELRTRPDILIGGGGGGSGSLTSFSSNDLSPLFTTSVANPTTTPALSFSLTNAAQNAVFAGPETGGAGAPAYRALTAADLPAGAGAPFADNIALIKDNVDATKLARFEASGITTGTTRVFALPDFNGSIITTGGTNSFSGQSLEVHVSGGSDVIDLRNLTASGGRLYLNSSGASLGGGGTPGIIVNSSAVVVNVGSDAQGDIYYRNSSGGFARLPKDTNATRYLSNTGTSNDPAWAQVNLANGVTGDLPFANLAQGTALSVLGVTGNSTADNASIAAGSDHQVLRRSGTSLAFGAVNLAQSSAVTGILAVANGGTGSATQNFVDLTTNQTASGDKTWSGSIILRSGTASAGTAPLYLPSGALLTVAENGAVERSGDDWYVTGLTQRHTLVRTDPSGNALIGSAAITGNRSVVVNSASTNASLTIAGQGTGSIFGTANSVTNNLLYSEFVTESTTSRSLTEADRGRIILCTNSGTVTITLANGLTQGFYVTIVKAGTGNVNISSPTTLNVAGGTASLTVQWSHGTFYHTGSNVWNGSGQFGAGTAVIADGDYGDIEVSSTGTVFTVEAINGLPIALTDPGADRILFWDDTAGTYEWLTLGTNLSITGTTLDAAGGGSGWAVTGDTTLTGASKIIGTTTNTIEFEFSGMAATIPADGAGLTLTTSDSASSGNQKVSPGLTWRGKGWDTSASTSQNVEFKAWLLPVQGTDPTGSLRFSSSINNAAYSDVVTIGADGTFTVLNGATTFTASPISNSFGTSGQANITTNGTTRYAISSVGDHSWAASAAATGARTLGTWTAPAHTNVTTATDVPSILFNLSATRQFAAGAKSVQREFRIQNPTYGAVGSTTTTDAYTLYVDGGPIAGTNMTITNSWAAGFNGNVQLGNITSLGNTGMAGTVREVIAIGSGSDIGLQFTQKGTGEINFVKSAVTSARFSFATNNIILSGGSADNTNPHLFTLSTPDGAGGQVHSGNILIKSGAAHTSGDNNAGNILIAPGLPNGAGTGGNIGLFTSTGSYAGGIRVMFVGNATTTPSGAVTAGTILYSTSGELHVLDGAGNDTLLSPHGFELTDKSEDMAWAYLSTREVNGVKKKINIDMLKAMRLVEHLSGEKLVYIE